MRCLLSKNSTAMTSSCLDCRRSRIACRELSGDVMAFHFANRDRAILLASFKIRS